LSRGRLTGGIYFGSNIQLPLLLEIGVVSKGEESYCQEGGLRGESISVVTSSCHYCWDSRSFIGGGILLSRGRLTGGIYFSSNIQLPLLLEIGVVSKGEESYCQEGGLRGESISVVTSSCHYCWDRRSFIGGGILLPQIRYRYFASIIGASSPSKLI
jgi:hypothetical protein